VPRQELETPVENQTAPQHDAYVAAPIARTKPADASAPMSTERQIERPQSREPEPFGLDAEPVVAGEILTK
jgi:hypothetical protein